MKQLISSLPGKGRAALRGTMLLSLTLLLGFAVKAQNCNNCTYNLLTNPSFETADASGWSWSGGSLYAGTGYQVCGSYNGYLQQSAGTARGWQSFTGLAAGTQVNFSGYFGTHTAGQSCSPKISIRFFNSGGTEISNVSLPITTNVDNAPYLPTYYSVSGVVPAGTVTTRAEISIGCDYVKIDGTCFTATGSIGDRVWNDANRNGLQDAGEVGVSGVGVTLFNSSGSPVASTVTDALGNYLFSNLPVSAAGVNYTVRFSLPAEYKFSPVNADAAGIAGSNNSDASVTTGTTGTITLNATTPNVSYVDAGIYYAIPARIGDFVWNDLNKDGIQNAGEPGIAGVTVSLYTSADVLYRATVTSNNGNYYFTDIAPGTYYIKVTPPIGYQFSPKNATTAAFDSDIDPATRKSGSITVVAGTNDLTIDAGLNVTPPTGGSASLGDRVWNDVNLNNLQDAGEPGVPNVTVQLYNTSNVLQATQTTDALGYYMFTGLNAGTYYVKFTLPSGYSFVTQNVGTNADINSKPATATGITANYGLVNDQVRTNIDAGLKATTSGAAIGDYVWYDLNKNGVQDGGAEIGVPGVTVLLYNSANTVVATTTTDGNGNYMFTGLSAATAYTVGFANLPFGYGFSPLSGAVTVTNNSDVNPATGRTATVTTGAAGSVITYVDAGLVITPNTFDSKGSIGDYVWNDLNNNGIQDAGEPGKMGITVTLYAADGVTVIATTTTDAQGKYIFTNLDAGSYVIGFSGLPAGYVFATQNAAGSNTGNDSNPNTGTGKTPPITLAAGEVNTTVDAGVRNSTSLSNLGDFVWFDFNSNGIQDAGEPGVPGVSVSLLNSSFAVVATTTTSASGKYLFTDIAAGTYYVKFGNLPAGYTATVKGATGAGVNSDADPVSLQTDAITLPAVSTDITWDFGIKSTTKGAIGDFVWNDLNRNGIQDSGEPGITGVLVTLYNSSNVAIATAVTDASGFYIFPNLDPGTYTVGFSNLPANSGFTTKDATTDAIDSDADPVTGKSPAITLVAGQVNNTVDAGIVTLLAAVGDYVWTDSNSNGIQEAGEPPVPGITATLYTTGPNGILGDADDVAVASAVTNGSGRYLINNIPVASGGSSFYVRFTDLQANNIFTLYNAAGSTAANNSDVTSQPATNGRTGLFTLTPGQINLDIDAGLIGPSNTTLPLHRLELSAVLHNATVDLTWVAENEMSTSYFSIQRSTDGTNFSDIAAKNVNGAINTPTTYNAPDDIQTLMSQPVIYYRIKAVDLQNNRAAYSNVVSVRLNKAGGLTVYPNPFAAEVKVSYYSAAASTLSVQLIDNAGRVVRSASYNLSRGQNNFALGGLETLAKGVYMLRMSDSQTGEVNISKLQK